jgi:hypothetical protein
VGVIKTPRQVAVDDFLTSLDDIRFGEIEPKPVVEHRQMMAVAVFRLLTDDDLEALALAALCRATTELNHYPQDRDVIAGFQAVRSAYEEVAQAGRN